MGNQRLKLTSVPSAWAEWRQKCPSGHWFVIVDRCAAKRGASRVVMGILPWSPREGAVINASWAASQLRYAQVRRGFQFEDELPLWVRERMSVLKVLDGEMWVPGVGGHFSPLLIRYYDPRKKTMDPAEHPEAGRYYVLDMQVL